MYGFTSTYNSSSDDLQIFRLSVYVCTVHVYVIESNHGTISRTHAAQSTQVSIRVIEQLCAIDWCVLHIHSHTNTQVAAMNGAGMCAKYNPMFQCRAIKTISIFSIHVADECCVACTCADNVYCVHDRNCVYVCVWKTNGRPLHSGTKMRTRERKPCENPKSRNM